MKVRNRSALAAVAMAAVAAVTTSGAANASWDSRSGDDDRQRAVGLGTDGTTLVSFRTDRGQKAKVLGSVRGLTGDTRLVGIDFRVQDGQLYGVGDAGGVYTIAGRRATPVSRLTTALSGTVFGVDFNPAANRLRVISDTGQNLRHNIDDGATAGTTIVDGTLTYPPATTPATGVAAAGYTNNDLDPATATTLLDVDVMLDQVAVQSPANAGSLAPTGKLGVDVTRAGFDTFSELQNGRAVRNVGYAVFTDGRRSTINRIDLLTGQATVTSRLAYPVADLAVRLDS
jgi:hypothetical protein